MAQIWSTNDSDVYGYVSSETSGTLGEPYKIDISLQGNYYWEITAHYYLDDGVEDSIAICSGYGGQTVYWTPPVSLAEYKTTSRTIYTSLNCDVYYNEDYVINTMRLSSIHFYIPFDPTISSCSITDSNGWFDVFGSYIQDESQLHVKIIANEASSYGVPIKSALFKLYQSDIKLSEYTIAAVKNTDGTYECAVSIPLTVSGNITIQYIVYDTRNNSTLGVNTITVLEYAKPTVEITNPYRCDSNGNPQYDGGYTCVSLNATATQLNNSNALAARIKYKPSDEVELPIGDYTAVELPSGYTRLDYIESSGTQYINTGFIPNQDTQVVCNYQAIKTTTNAGGGLFGARVSKGNLDYSFWHYNKDAAVSQDDYNNSIIDTIPLISNKTVVNKNKNTTIVGGVTYTHTYTSFTCTCPLFIFAINTNGSKDSQVAYFRIYSFKIYDNGTLIRDYYPAVNTSGTAGLYDLVNDVFYTNAGSGSFIEGPTYETTISDSTLTVTVKTIIFPIDSDKEYTITGECEDKINTVGSVIKRLLKVSPLIDIDRDNNAFGFGILAEGTNTARFGPEAIFNNGGTFEGPATFEQASTFKQFATFEQGTNLPMYGYNFLDNSDFRIIVNQGICTSDFVFDRWHGDCTVTEITENNYHRSGITIPSGGKIWQAVPMYDLDNNTKPTYYLNVKSTLTLAAMTTDGTIHILTGKIDDNPSSSIMKMYRNSLNHMYGYIELYAGSYKWIALYEGEYNEGTLPIYHSKGYEKELLNCQKYCQKVSYLLGGSPGYYHYSNGTYVNGVRYEEAYTYLTVPLKAPMNHDNSPTVRLTDTSSYWCYYKSEDYDIISDIVSIDSYNLTESTITFYITHLNQPYSSSSYVNTTYTMLVLTSLNDVVLDASI